MGRYLSISVSLITGLLLAACAQAPAHVEQHGSAFFGRSHHYPVPHIKNSEDSDTVVVQEGDTLYDIAKTYKTPLRTLIDVNSLAPPYVLSVGKTLKIPHKRFHVVDHGETLYGLSRFYGVDMNQITQLNKLSVPYSLTVGQKLRIPPKSYASKGVDDYKKRTAVHRSRVASSAKPIPPKRKSSSDSSISAKTGVVKTHRPKSFYTTKKQTGSKKKRYAKTLSKFSWPVNGKVISSFGPKGGGLHNDGINILAKEGSPIKAAADGTVVYTGNGIKSYGNLLIIRHKKGYLTAYAHTKRILVKKGQKIRKGDLIARVGKTGNVDRPQLHFGIRKGRKALDPEAYLAS